MNGMIEKFSILITDSGLSLRGPEGASLEFTAVQALMLLDILRNEEQNLRRMADEASPLPVRFSAGTGEKEA